MKKAFVIVGHAHWGKSETLKSLTDDNYRYHWIEIKDKWIFIKRMSNDDDEKKLRDFIKKNTMDKDTLILTFCPSFEKGKKGHEILKSLINKKFKLYFFILKNKYGTDETISDDEI